MTDYATLNYCPHVTTEQREGAEVYCRVCVPQVIASLRASIIQKDAEIKRLREDLRAATQELMTLAHEKPHDVEIYAEEGKKYIIRWDNGDDSVGIRAGWVSEDLDEVFDTKKRLRGAVDWALGERDFFPSRPEGKGAYWWRIELRERAGVK